MQPRMDYTKVAPEAIAALRGVEDYVRQCGLERSLVELVKLRASQINGCAYCVDMHTKDARTLGETEQRLYAVAVWQETPFFSERERAALAWAEAVTLVSASRVPDAVYDQARRHFNGKELMDLTVAIIAINGWNRLAVSFRALAGTYDPTKANGQQRPAKRESSLQVCGDGESR
ncbi:MAG TPA: carboxymuconolactone decarboxylase family protein [Candidatus Dormibacteraeota bacterium]|nr:carboxymuconolactone decarboxylase family protein [Candidatus Dormibacteraeota bacterium]